MNVIEKRDFMHSHLHQVDESLINEFYETLRKEDVYIHQKNQHSFILLHQKKDE